MADANLTDARLHEVLSYDPDTGVFTWLKRIARCVRIGDRAGSEIGPYRRIRIDGHDYSTSHLAVFYMTSIWPTLWVDHMDTDKRNDRWLNLREATPTTNAQNRRQAEITNPSGMLGVTKLPNGRFRARIVVNGKELSLGTFGMAAVGHAVYLDHKRQLHPGNTL